MAIKGTSTKSDYLEWDTMLLLLQKLEKNQEYKFQLLIAVGSYTGLRISDLLKLKWCDVLDHDYVELIEGKTGKKRKININPALAAIVTRLSQKMEVKDYDQFLFMNRFGTKPINVQFVNRKLKEINKKYLNGNKINFSSHSFRKTLGRHVWAINDYSEKSLVLLGEMFNHSSVKITKIYLGIKEQEIGDVYLNL
ncbi:MAG: tyrosine-type recombinase/integrase [bacterium]